MNHRRRFLLAIVSVLVGLLTSSVGTSGLRAQDVPAPVSLTIGLVLPPGEPEATNILRGAEIGAALARAETGQAVELCVRGSPGQWGTEGDDAVALALDAGVQALIAPTTGATVHLVEQVAGRARIPTVSLCADRSVTGARLPWVLRLVPDTATEARALLRGVHAAHPGPLPRRWAALVPEGRAGREAASDLRAAVTAVETTLVAVESVTTTATNLKPTLARLLQSRPEGVLLWLDPVLAGRWVRALREAGHAGLLAGPGRLAGPSFLSAAGPAAEGFFSTRPVLVAASHELRARFLERFRAQFGEESDPVAAAAADAVRLLVTVLRDAGGQPAFARFPLREPLAGLTGPLEFDPVGNRRVELEPVVVRQDRFVPLP